MRDFGWEHGKMIRVISSESGGLYMTQGVSKGSRHAGSRGNWGQAEHSVQLDAGGGCGRSTYEEAPRILRDYYYGIIIVIYYT